MARGAILTLADQLLSSASNFALRALSATVSIIAMVVLVNAFGLLAPDVGVVTACTYTVEVLIVYRRCTGASQSMSLDGPNDTTSRPHAGNPS